MPKVDGVLETALYVDDLDRSAQFYRTIFNFELLVCNERMRVMNVADKQVLLLFKKGGSLNIPAPHDGSGSTHLAFATPTSELESWQVWLKENGIPIELKESWPESGTSLYFRDPDDHVLELASPGIWSIY